MSYAVSQGTRDIGTRMALGATPNQILWMVVGQGVNVIALGVTVGLAGAVILGSVFDSLLFGIEPTDPITLAAVSLLLASVAIIGSCIPARRAARINPALSLRSE